MFAKTCITLCTFFLLGCSQHQIHSKVSLDFENQIESSVVLISHTKPIIKNALGTGFLVSRDGLVITADHIIFEEESNTIFPTLYALQMIGEDIHHYKLEVIKRFKEGQKGRDIAILRIDGNDTTTFPFLKNRQGFI